MKLHAAPEKRTRGMGLLVVASIAVPLAWLFWYLVYKNRYRDDEVVFEYDADAVAGWERDGFRRRWVRIERVRIAEAWHVRRLAVNLRTTDGRGCCLDISKLSEDDIDLVLEDNAIAELAFT